MIHAIVSSRGAACFALLLSLFASGCSDGGGTVTEKLIPVATVAIQDPPTELYIGASVQLTAVTRDANGTVLNGRTVTWASSDTAVARVTAGGMVTGRRSNPVFITAVSEGKEATIILNVMLEPVATINVTGKPTGPVRAGTTFQLQATGLNAAGAVLDRPVTWFSTNPFAATVTPQGLVTAVRGGETTIHASMTGTTSMFTLQVLDTVATVAVTPATAALYASQTVDLSASAMSAHATPLTGRPVSWSTSNPARATVDGTGKVTGVSAGEVSITATVEGKTASATILVRARPVANWSGAAEWTTFQGNARHTGYVPVTADPVVFRELWTRQPLGDVHLNPAAAGGGRVFISGGTRAAALDARTGATAWSYEMGNTVFSVDPPAYANGRVFVAAGGSSDSFLYGLDAATGDVAFRTAYGNQWYSWYAPVVSGGKVFKGGGSYGGLYAYSASSGDELWFQNISQDDRWTPAVDGGRVYAYTSPSQQGELRVHDAATGALLFGIPDPGWGWGLITIHPTPVLGGRNNVLLVQGNRLVSFDLASRTVGWQRTGPFIRAPLVADGRIYVFSTLDVEVRNESDGSLAWIWHSPTNQYGESMIVTDNLLFVSVRGQTFAIDLAARQQVWSYPKGGHITLTPEGILVIADEDGGLAAIDLK